MGDAVSTDPYGTRRIELMVRDWVASSACDLEHVHPDNLKTYVHYLMENLAHIISMKLRMPCLELQKDEVVADWPATWWDHLKCRLGLKYEVTQLRCSEVLAIPEIPVGLERYKVFHVADFRRVTPSDEVADEF